MLDSQRQAGALGRSPLSEAGGLSLNFSDDALNLAGCDAKTTRSCYIAEPKSPVRAYLDGGAYLELELRSVWPNASIVEKASGGSPFIHGAHRHAALSGIDAYAAGASIREGHHAMCAAVPKLVECPDGRIASFACVLAQHEGDYVFVNVFAAASLDVVLKAVGGVSDQELRACRIAAKQENGAGVYSMIEGIAKVASDGPDVHADLSGDISRILDVEKVLASFAVQLGAEDPVLTANEGFHSLFETGDAFLRLVS